MPPTTSAVLALLWLVSVLVGGPSKGQTLICDVGASCASVYARGVLVAGGAVAGMFALILTAVAGARWDRCAAPRRLIRAVPGVRPAGCAGEQEWFHAGSHYAVWAQIHDLVDVYADRETFDRAAHVAAESWLMRPNDEAAHVQWLAERRAWLSEYARSHQRAL